MSRTQKQGLDYFPFAVDFFSDNRIRILKARYGCDGIAVYIYLLCHTYREGYYAKADEDVIFVISDDLNISPDTVRQVLKFLIERSLFNDKLFYSDTIITSTGIQERWQHAVSQRAAKTPMEVEGKFWLLPEKDTRPFIKCAFFGNSSEKNTLSSEKKENNSENYTQRKTNKTKENESIKKEREDSSSVSQLFSNPFTVINGNLEFEEWQISGLLDLMGPEQFAIYTDKLSQFIKNGGVIKKSPFRIISKWYYEDFDCNDDFIP